MAKPFQTAGYEDMELSTQIVIKEALSRKIKVEIVDRSTNLIRVSKGRHIEYIQEATKTTRTPYITSLIINNKKASKYILHEQGIRVPQGMDYNDIKIALKDYKLFKKQKTVVKPKTTNFGIGVTILEENFSVDAFKKALTHAFSYDNAVLVEEYIEGTEYRFLVIKDKTIGVINRVPANVTGDGKHSVEELVATKNKSPMRGEWCRAPLEYILIGETEKDVLKEQNLSSQSIPKKGQQVFLRHNSNLSSGGDSMDCTDSVHKDYKKIAERATKSVDALICGVDIIIQNSSKPPTSKNHGIIEINDNPGLTMHNFPFKGKNRNTRKYILDLLGF
jgi:glutamate--cysteine ligase